jgi:hypothetical protein
MMRSATLALVALACVVGLAAPAGAHTLPTAGVHFSYTESTILNNGAGNYSGYTEGTFTNGSISVISIAPNGTDNSSFQYTYNYENNEGQTQSQSAAGTFSFSPTTYHYVAGSDNQTAPGTSAASLYVWFYMDNSLSNGSTFYLLSDSFTVLSTDQAFPLASSSTGWVKTIYADGTGSYQRNDEYGVFNAVYNYQVYFDPATGFIVGYVYTETDTDGSGDGFTWTDTLAVTSTSYALTPAAAPPPPPASSTGTDDAVLGLIVIVVIVVLIVAVVFALSRRRRAPMARHSVQGNVTFNPMYPPPPGLNMTGGGQPAVQQIVIKETVKVNCRYCGTLIDTTATVCPKCGAPRT